MEDRLHKLQSLVSWCGLVVKQWGALVYICGDKFIILGLSAVCHCLYTPKPAAIAGIWQICVYVCVRERLREKDGSPQSAVTLNDLASKWCNDTKDWWYRVTVWTLSLFFPVLTLLCTHIQLLSIYNEMYLFNGKIDRTANSVKEQTKWQTTLPPWRQQDQPQQRSKTIIIIKMLCSPTLAGFEDGKTTEYFPVLAMPEITPLFTHSLLFI